MNNIEFWQVPQLSTAFFTQFLGKKVDILLVTALGGIEELDQCQSLQCTNFKPNNWPKLSCFPSHLHSVVLNTNVLLKVLFFHPASL